MNLTHCLNITGKVDLILNIKLNTEKSLLILSFMVFTPFSTMAAPISLPLPPHIFEWVQSSARAGYWFNKTEIYYGITNGIIDTNRLTVPIMKVYDDVQINEVITKRRWHDQSLAGYEILAGAAEYLEFNLSEKSVTIKRHEELDNTWTVLSSEMPNKKIYLEKMSDKNVDKNFYMAILDFAKKHDEEIMKRSLTKGKLPAQKNNDTKVKNKR